MMTYSSAWWLIVAVGCVAIAAVYVLIRRIPSGYVRALLCALLLALFLTPAPVPAHPPNYAPAFIVALFEGVLQSNGNPGVALRLLLAGLTAAFALVTLGAVGLRRWKHRSPAQEE